MLAVDATPSLIEVPVAHGRVVFSTRRGGVSDGPYASLNVGAATDDGGDRVAENRRRLAAAARVDPAAVAMGLQVHGADLRSWDAPPRASTFAAGGGASDRVDGHLTRVRGLPLLVVVADCLPVALVGARRVAMLHCGWRGLAAGILERALAAFDEPPAAVIGPGIGGCCYEVGPEVLERFADLDGVAEGSMLDLKAVARARLRVAGAGAVVDVGLCTSCRADLFFSHRRDHGVTGRQAGMAWLT